MSNLDDSIGKLLLQIQKDDPEVFKKIMTRALEENPELFESGIDESNNLIDNYNSVDK